jgi:hypothetical protein
MKKQQKLLTNEQWELIEPLLMMSIYQYLRSFDIARVFRSLPARSLNDLSRRLWCEFTPSNKSPAP